MAESNSQHTVLAQKFFLGLIKTAIIPSFFNIKRFHLKTITILVGGRFEFLLRILGR